MTLRATNPPTNEHIAVNMPFPWGVKYPLTMAGDMPYRKQKTISGALYITETTFPTEGSAFTWVWYDTPSLTEFSKPASVGASTFGPSGTFEIVVTTNLSAGDLGFLMITNCTTTANCRTHAMPTEMT